MVIPEPTSTQEIWWGLFRLYLAGAVILAGTVSAVFLYLLHRFREGRVKSNPNNSEMKVGWSKYFFIATSFTVVSLTLLSIQYVDDLWEPPIEGNNFLVVKVTGFRYGWEFEYTYNGVYKRSVGIAVVPTDTVVVFKVTSRDVFHSFGIPEFKGKIDAIPGILNQFWIRTPAQPANYTIYCYELCGPGHTYMRAQLVVVTPDEFERWLREG